MFNLPKNAARRRERYVSQTRSFEMKNNGYGNFLLVLLVLVLDGNSHTSQVNVVLVECASLTLEYVVQF